MSRKRDQPSRERKDDQIRVRVTAEQKTAFVREADRAGVSLSSWMVSTCLQAVRT
jgi:predicted HicB family RNase H-like nuclease